MLCLNVWQFCVLQSYEQRLQASEAKNAELAGQLSHAKENVKASSDQHARIMELQVHFKRDALADAYGHDHFFGLDHGMCTRIPRLCMNPVQQI